MSLRVFAAAVLTVALMGGSAEAGFLSSGSKLPKPINLIGKQVQRSENIGMQQRHPPRKYSSPEWGARWDVITKPGPRPLLPYLRR